MKVIEIYVEIYVSISLLTILLSLIIYGDKQEDDRVFLVLLNKVAMKYLRDSELEVLSFEFRSV